MRKQTVQLQNADGSHRQWLSQPEVQRLELRGDAKRVSRVKDKKIIYRLVGIPMPSESREDAPELTLSDMHAIVGLVPLDQHRKERLAGRGFFHRSLYPKPYAAGVRTSFFAAPEEATAPQMA